MEKYGKVIQEGGSGMVIFLQHCQKLQKLQAIPLKKNDLLV